VGSGAACVAPMLDPEIPRPNVSRRNAALQMSFAGGAGGGEAASLMLIAKVFESLEF
jgi:hypothetical protein